MLQKNSYLENFANDYFKTFLNSKHRFQENMTIVHKRPLFFFFLRAIILKLLIIGNRLHHQNVCEFTT